MPLGPPSLPFDVVYGPAPAYTALIGADLVAAQREEGSRRGAGVTLIAGRVRSDKAS